MVAGCGPKVALYPVSGTVEFRGELLNTGVVAFHHDDGVSPIAKGDIQSNGNFSLETFKPGDGAVAGTYAVTVTAMIPGHGIEGQDADYRPPKPLVPIKYMRLLETPLKATVEEKENLIKLSLSP
jgi:hypothetical protein